MLQNFVFLAFLNILCIEAKLDSCEDSLENEICYGQVPYSPSVNPEPLPNIINITMNVNDVIEVNEEDQTVKLMLKLILEWYDPRISVKRSQEYVER